MTNEKVKVVILSGDDPVFREKLKSLIEASDGELVQEGDPRKVLMVDDFPRLDPLVLKKLEYSDIAPNLWLKDNKPWYHQYRKNKY